MRMGGGQSAGARLHRLEHGACLGAPDLAHDQPGQVLAQRLRDEIGHTPLPDMPVALLLSEPHLRLERQHVTASRLQVG